MDQISYLQTDQTNRIILFHQVYNIIWYSDLKDNAQCHKAHNDPQ